MFFVFTLDFTFYIRLERRERERETNLIVRMGDHDRRDSEQKRLLRHAVGVFGFSTWIAGMGQAFAAVRKIGSESQFRTAHVGGTMHAVFMFAMAGCIREFRLSKSEKDSLVWWTIVMGWGNTLGYTVGAFLRHRGLKPGGLNNPPLALFLTAMYALVRVLQLSWRGSQRMV